MNDQIWKPNFIKHKPLICDFIAHINKNYAQSLPKDQFPPLHQWSINHLEDFWNAVWDFSSIVGDKGDTTLQEIDHVPYARFFPNGKISYAENMLTHWQKNPNKPAIIYRHQNNSDRIVSGQDLCEQVSLWEQALRRAGVQKDDVVGVYLPNVPETDLILLATSNIGAIFCSAGMEMGGDDLINRFGAVKPKILITADGYQHGDKIIDRTTNIKNAKTQIPDLKTIIRIPVQGVETSDNFLTDLSPEPLTFTRHNFNHPLYILFSSGTTGVPKCFVHSSGGALLKHMCEYKLQADVQPNDRTFYHATPSWMMWNWAISALGAGATVLKYDGNPFYPDPTAQLKFTSENKCTHHGTAAPVIMAWRDQKLNVKNDLDFSDMRTMLYTGAILPEQGFHYITENIKQDIQISGICGGTDLVASFIAGNPITPVYPGQIAGAILGNDIQVWNDDAKPAAIGEAGELVCANVFPSMPLYFHGDKTGAHYRDAYYNFYADMGKKVWRHGDTIQTTKERQIVIIGRSDGTLNQNGVRIGSGALYNQLDPFPEITDSCAVDFTRPDTKQSITILFIVTDKLTEDLTDTIRKAVKNNVGPYSVPTEIISAPGVLRTKNGKLAEVVTKKILAGTQPPNANLYGAKLVEFYKGIAKTLNDKYK